MTADLAPRRMDATEAPAVLALLQAAFVGMEDRIDPPSSLNRLTLAEVTAAEVWVIGDPIRACVFVKHPPGKIYLGKLAVAHTARGTGLSRILVSHAVQLARATGATCVELETRIELVENHTIFRKLGFVEVARKAHPGFPNPTSITMQMRLDQIPAAIAATPR